MEERLRFVARLLEGEGMSAVCREFGISRKTGYKIFSRYRETEQFQEDAEIYMLGETLEKNSSEEAPPNDGAGNDGLNRRCISTGSSNAPFRC